jgi:hypothetical protein
LLRHVKLLGFIVPKFVNACDFMDHVEVGEKKGEERKLGNLVARPRWNDTAGVPVPLTATDRQRHAIENVFDHTLHSPNQALEEVRIGNVAAWRTDPRESLEDQLNRPQVAEYNYEEGGCQDPGSPIEELGADEVEDRHRKGSKPLSVLDPFFPASRDGVQQIVASSKPDNQKPRNNY